MPQLAEISTSDAALVAQSAAGDKSAFTRLVERYQSLICAIAYNATGNLAQSEDLSQEIFITAWKQLPALRDPAHFRPWLCGIARNLINNARRAAARHPTQSLDAPIEDPIDPPATTEDPAATAISREEESLLWRSLERIPDSCREPLILFYRQQQSIEQVAAALDLSEDAVKQRLSRGRKLLQQSLAAFVEHTLQRSNPGKTFALGVALALPAVAASTSRAATLATATAATGSATAKGASLFALLTAILSPLLMIFGIWSSYRLGLETSTSPGEHAFIKSFYRRLSFAIAAFTVPFCLLLAFGRQLQHSHPQLLATLVCTLVSAYALAIGILSRWAHNQRRLLRELPAHSANQLPVEEYCSPHTFLGVPLLHMRRHGGLNDRAPLAWISCGDNARALLFAFGGTATAPIAVGGRAVGLFAWGGLAIGPFAMGGFSIGLFSLGGLALGYQSFGGCALAWKFAAGAIALAHDFADGFLAIAPHANDSLSSQFLNASWFFHAGNTFSDYALWFNALWALPLFLWWRAVKRKKSQPPTT